MMETVRLLFQGVALAVANLIPGVSGGTMAVMLGIYERLLESISRVAGKPFGSWSEVGWLARLGVGGVLGLVVFAKVIGWALDHHPEVTFLLFMGLIVGSLPCVLRFHDMRQMKLPQMLVLALGFVLVVYLGERAMAAEANKAVAELAAEAGAVEETSLLLLGLGGVLAGGAMIVPGVSGSLMLLLVGMYDDALAAVNDRDFLALAVLGGSVAVGIVVFAKLIRFLYQRFPIGTHAFVIGLVAASAVVVFRGFTEGVAGLLLGGVAFIVGALVAFRFSGKSD